MPGVLFALNGYALMQAIAMEDTSGSNLAETQNQPPSSDHPAPPADKNHNPAKHRWWEHKIAISIVGVAVVLAIVASLYAIKQHNDLAKAKSGAAKTSTKISLSDNESAAVNANKITSNSFFPTAKKLDQDLRFFKNPESYFGQICTGSNGTDCKPSVTASDITYYQIGTTKSNQRIIVASYDQGGESSFKYTAIETQPNKFAILARLDSQLEQQATSADPTYKQGLNDFKNALSSNVTLNTTDTIIELVFPDSLTISNTPIKLAFTDGPSGYALVHGLNDIRGSYFSDGSSQPALRKLTDSNGKTFYEVTAEDKDNYQVMELYGTVNAVYAADYIPDDPLVTDDNHPLKVAWTSGSQNTSGYTSPAFGCGSATGYEIAKNLSIDQLTAAGTVNGQTLYQLPPSSPLFTEFYQDYQGEQDLLDSSLANFSTSEFQNAHAVFVTQNSLGELQVYQRDDMFVVGGCGKPVVYLYPQTPTRVNVAVDADVKKSDPLYTTMGWQNVLAYPDGQLVYQGKNYNSLYWEGFGKGQYPPIESGTVVASSTAVAAIRSQLAQQGLNTHEVNDFMNFWKPKLPKTPYVRLTWLNTTQMNKLAPLHISPLPKTIIRVFLDFQGLNNPISLPPQKLSAPVRQGFTVVEWGGLLRDGSITR